MKVVTLPPVSYEQTAITYVWKNAEDTLRKSPSLTTLNAYLIDNKTITCPIKAIWRGKAHVVFYYWRRFYHCFHVIRPRIVDIYQFIIK